MQVQAKNGIYLKDLAESMCSERFKFYHNFKASIKHDLARTS